MSRCQKQFKQFATHGPLHETKQSIPAVVCYHS